ncbi:MAG: hypothetical protein RIN56_16580 [Sporomusaceae bacterium]|nr:hypothetical protein [Sporomusaceae bacterium]
MYIFASFAHGLHLEIAIADLTRIGLTTKHILAVPLRRTTRKLSVFDRIYRADGYSILDGAALAGTVGMIAGVIFGSVHYWGPIIWGLAGLALGGSAGLAADWIVTSRRIEAGRQSNLVPVLLLVRCDELQAETVEKTLEQHQALGLARYQEQSLPPE